MTISYKDHIIEPAVYDPPAGSPFNPRVSVRRNIGDSMFENMLDWPAECGSREEAERLAIELAKRKIDEGLEFD